jgi:hypothetical protein
MVEMGLNTYKQKLTRASCVKKKKGYKKSAFWGVLNRNARSTRNISRSPFRQLGTRRKERVQCTKKGRGLTSRSTKRWNIGEAMTTFIYVCRTFVAPSERCGMPVGHVTVPLCCLALMLPPPAFKSRKLCQDVEVGGTSTSSERKLFL